MFSWRSIAKELQLIERHRECLCTERNSGAHSGEAIPLEELDELSAELNRISETGRSSPMMQEFVSALQQLIRAAKDEGNPIVFV